MSNGTEPSPQQQETVNQALAALETMAQLWGVEIRLRQMVSKISAMPRLQMIEAIEALAIQGFIEGAYRHYTDVQDGKVPNMHYTGRITP